MFWVKDVDHNPVNLALAEMIVATNRGGYHLYAIFRTGVEATLYIGEPAEVGKIRDQLYERLTRHQEGYHVVE